jgi:hypothetical protein
MKKRMLRNLQFGLPWLIVGILLTLLWQSKSVEASPDFQEIEMRIATLEEMLEHFSRDGDDIFIARANLHVINGEGSTASTNGLGNVFIGYNELRGADNERSGSHMLVVGTRHNFTSYGGIVVGQNNETSGPYASVSGGAANTASGGSTSVSGGRGNTASSSFASVTGGSGNTASGSSASVTGGSGNTASGSSASVSGGRRNTASAASASVSGGVLNTASANFASVSGGNSNTAGERSASVSGGAANTASGSSASVSGGRRNTASADFTSVSGEPNAAPPCFDNNNRYVDCGNGTVMDTVTGLLWLKDANCFGQEDYATANTLVARLKDGDCGLTDNSAPGDWRLPTKEEWEVTTAEALVLGCVGPSLTNTEGTACGPEPFTGALSNRFWSSFTLTSLPTFAWHVDTNFGAVGTDAKAENRFVWPVRR